MECPTSFHITCIAPKCRFHELALLCHEHAHTNKLPYLDYMSSVQVMVETKVDERFTTSVGKKDKKLVYAHFSKSNGRANYFLPGLRGDIYTSDQAHVEQLLNDSQVMDTSGFFPSFFFPVEIRNEVRVLDPCFFLISFLF